MDGIRTIWRYPLSTDQGILLKLHNLFTNLAGDDLREGWRV